MKKIVFAFVIFILMILPNKTYSADISQDLIKDQEETFGLADFLKETRKYSSNFFEDTDISEIFNSAISGKIDNNTIGRKILKIVGLDISDTLKTLVKILAIVLIHSILKAITDNLEGSTVSQVIYYVQYILIVSLIMENFAGILETTIETINNLVRIYEYTNSISNHFNDIYWKRSNKWTYPANTDFCNYFNRKYNSKLNNSNCFNNCCTKHNI